MGKEGQKNETSKQAPTRKTKAAVDRRQNNKMLRQCPSGIAQRPPHHAIAVPTALLLSVLTGQLIHCRQFVLLSYRPSASKAIAAIRTGLS